MDEYKMAVHVNERAFEDFKDFSRALLDHVNPYTKLRYADDPALAWLSLVNEDNPGNFIGRLEGRRARRLAARLERLAGGPLPGARGS